MDGAQSNQSAGGESWPAETTALDEAVVGGGLTYVCAVFPREHADPVKRARLADEFTVAHERAVALEQPVALAAPSSHLRLDRRERREPKRRDSPHRRDRDTPQMDRHGDLDGKSAIRRRAGGLNPVRRSP